MSAAGPNGALLPRRAHGAPALLRTRPVLVTGGAGFIGSNLADRLAAEGEQVLVFDALARPGVDANLRWLERRHPRRVTAVIADTRDAAAVADAAAEASAVFHLAGQVAVTTSLLEPVEDFDVNVRGTIHLLEALRRRARPAPLVFASTNKVYGDLADVPLDAEADAYAPREPSLRSHGVGEDRSLEFHTPYGCSKGAADQYVLDYARSFDVPTAVLRMSCIYGPRQLGTEDQGWVAHFLIRALSGAPITVYGDGRQVRDVLHVSDVVDAYLRAWRRMPAARGRALNVGGGPANAISLRRLLRFVETLTEAPLRLAFADWRPGDQRWYVSDTRRARATLGLGPPTDWQEGVAALARWFREERGLGVPPAAAPAAARIAGASS